ncbi:type II toxin-antitoxin system PemK/MazF family toxin [Lysobacter sp.]|uniref:type II toxin-antitoxin system PemK/MazF family toxin n=1 Tax=Lysobacter sp. TaxID=72226 RepID=UPI002D6EDB36|nr:type II toxin-antitoxin system PemK/MazF family toxin [Lysobacter sp.]HZX77317.1 type II toxin-antitoxin system PemK/MazF family toxin [Lysobacter sp.]
MALRFKPKVGDILMCEFPVCFKAPEMIKSRAVIVVSPQLQGRPDLAAVVPISNTPPNPVCTHHCQIPVRFLPKFMQATGGVRWAKCDMLYTFSHARLELIKLGRDRATGKRLYDHPRLDLETLQEVRRAIAAGLGIDGALWTPSAAPAACTSAAATPAQDLSRSLPINDLRRLRNPVKAT